MAGDLLLVDTVGGDHNVVHALDLATLTERWWRRWEGDGWLTACGDVLCLRRYEEYGRTTTSVIDPETGDELWSTDGWIQAVGDRFLSWPVDTPPTPGRRVDTRLMAPRTGETLVYLAGWAVVGTGDDGTVVLTMPTSAGTAVARLDPDGTTPRYLGRVTGTFSHCVPFDGGMVCDGSAGVTVWAFH